jgi:hypothetical protein
MGEYWEFPVTSLGPVPDGHHPLTHDLSPEACALCHPEQYRQWKTSFHAKAISKGLVGQLPAFDESTQRECLNCHGPRSEQQRLWQSLGIEGLARLHGVDCATCHVRAYQRYGPNNRSETPHGPVKGLRLFHQSTFCSPCHQFDEESEQVNGKWLENTYREWLNSPYPRAGKHCQDCHMENKSHTFKGIHDPEMTQRGLKVVAQRVADGVHLRVWNNGAGHALPTYATPQIQILIEAHDDPEKRREYLIQRQLAWEAETGWKELSDTRLLPYQGVDLSLEVDPNEQVKITVRVQPDAYYHQQVYPTLLQLIGEALDDTPRNLLEEAMTAAGKTGYPLYRIVCDYWHGTDDACKIKAPVSLNANTN